MNYHDIKFEIETKIPVAFKIYHDVTVKYKTDGLFGDGGYADFALYFHNSYVSLDMDIDTFIIGNFGGVCSLDRMHQTDLELPTEFIEALLKVKLKERSIL